MQMSCMKQMSEPLIRLWWNLQKWCIPAGCFYYRQVRSPRRELHCRRSRFRRKSGLMKSLKSSVLRVNCCRINSNLGILLIFSVNFVLWVNLGQFKQHEAWNLLLCQRLGNRSREDILSGRGATHRARPQLCTQGSIWLHISTLWYLWCISIYLYQMY